MAGFSDGVKTTIIIKYKQNKSNTAHLMILLMCIPTLGVGQRIETGDDDDDDDDIFLHCFLQQHVSAAVMSHLQVDCFSLVRQIIQLAMLLLLLPPGTRITYIKIFEIRLIPLYSCIQID
jgi:hypothetical protein